MRKSKYTEIFKLKEMLDKANINYEFYDRIEEEKKNVLSSVKGKLPLFLKDYYNTVEFYQIIIRKNNVSPEDCETPEEYEENSRLISVIQGHSSHGQHLDKLEIMGLVENGNDKVEGYLEAKEVFRRIKKYMDSEGNSDMRKRFDDVEDRLLDREEVALFMDLMEAISQHGIATTTEMARILNVAEEIGIERKEKRKLKIKNEREERKKVIDSELSRLEKKIEQEFGKEFLDVLKDEYDKFEKNMGGFDKLLEKEGRGLIEKIDEALRKALMESKGLHKFIVTFGSGQENEGKYLVINTESKDIVASYMKDKYDGKYSMIYSEKEWAEWVEKATKEGVTLETELLEIFLVRSEKK